MAQWTVPAQATPAHDHPMLAATCPACDRRMLFGYDRIVSFESRERRHDVGLTCRCGARVRWTVRARDPFTTR